MAEQRIADPRVMGSNPIISFQLKRVVSLMVMISAFQAEGPGSIPGRRIFVSILSFSILILTSFFQNFNQYFTRLNQIIIKSRCSIVVIASAL